MKHHPGYLRDSTYLGKLIRVVNNNRPKTNINRRFPFVQEFLQLIRGLEGARKIQKHETRDINLWTPVLWLRNQAWRPHVRIRYFEPVQLPGRPYFADLFEMQDLGAETVDQIAKTLPHHNLDKRVGHEVAVGGLDVGGFDVR
jgi:hypothetical protein